MIPGSSHFQDQVIKLGVRSFDNPEIMPHFTPWKPCLILIWVFDTNHDMSCIPAETHLQFFIYFVFHYSSNPCEFRFYIFRTSLKLLDVTLYAIPSLTGQYYALLNFTTDSTACTILTISNFEGYLIVMNNLL